MIEKALLIAIASLFIGFSANGQSDINLYVIPAEFSGHKVYIEKFSQIQFKDLTDEDLELIKGNDSITRMEKFSELLDYYNSSWYRDLNKGIKEEIADLKFKDEFATIYRREFEESPDTTDRFIIYNNFSIVEIFAEANYSLNDAQADAAFSYYIYDRDSQTKHRDVSSLQNLLSKVDKYKQLEQNGTLHKLTRDEIEILVTETVSEEKRPRNSANVGLFAFIVGVPLLSIIIAVLVQQD